MEIINIRGVLMYILCKISSYYNAYVTRYKKGFKQILLLCKNALYGKMVASLIYYHNFNNILIRIEFDINLYDTCVSNKVINRSHMSI